MAVARAYSRGMRLGDGDFIDRLREEWARERPDLDTSGIAIVGRIILAGRALEARTNLVLREFDLNYSDFDVLATLRRSGPPYELMPTQIRESVLLTSGAMTALLDRLERRKLIARATQSGDRRVSTALLTAAGAAMVDRAIGARFEDAALVALGISSEKRQSFERALRAFVLSLDITAQRATDAGIAD